MKLTDAAKEVLRTREILWLVGRPQRATRTKVLRTVGPDKVDDTDVETIRSVATLDPVPTLVMRQRKNDQPPSLRVYRCGDNAYASPFLDSEAMSASEEEYLEPVPKLLAEWMASRSATQTRNRRHRHVFNMLRLIELTWYSTPLAVRRPLDRHLMDQYGRPFDSLEVDRALIHNLLNAYCARRKDLTYAEIAKDKERPLLIRLCAILRELRSHGLTTDQLSAAFQYHWSQCKMIGMPSEATAEQWIRTVVTHIENITGLEDLGLIATGKDLGTPAYVDDVQHRTLTTVAHREVPRVTKKGKTIMVSFVDTDGVVKEMKAGKYWRRVFPDAHEQSINYLANMSAAHVSANELIVTTDPKEIAKIYRASESGNRSCMTHAHNSYHFCMDAVGTMPVEAYGNETIGLAYIKTARGSIRSRAIVNLVSKKWVRIYGESAVMTKQLRAAGFTGSGDLHGTKLNRLWDIPGKVLVMPYLDEGGDIYKIAGSDDDEFIELTRLRSGRTLLPYQNASQYGAAYRSSGSRSKQCDCCGNTTYVRVTPEEYLAAVDRVTAKGVDYTASKGTPTFVGVEHTPDGSKQTRTVCMAHVHLRKTIYMRRHRTGRIRTSLRLGDHTIAGDVEGTWHPLPAGDNCLTTKAETAALEFRKRVIDYIITKGITEEAVMVSPEMTARIGLIYTDVTMRSGKFTGYVRNEDVVPIDGEFVMRDCLTQIGGEWFQRGQLLDETMQSLLAVDADNQLHLLQDVLTGDMSTDMHVTTLDDFIRSLYERTVSEPKMTMIPVEGMSVPLEFYPEQLLSRCGGGSLQDIVILRQHTVLVKQRDGIIQHHYPDTTAMKDTAMYMLLSLHKADVSNMSEEFIASAMRNGTEKRKFFGRLASAVVVANEQLFLAIMGFLARKGVADVAKFRAWKTADMVAGGYSDYTMPDQEPSFELPVAERILKDCTARSRVGHVSVQPAKDAMHYGDVATFAAAGFGRTTSSGTFTATAEYTTTYIVQSGELA